MADSNADDKTTRTTVSDIRKVVENANAEDENRDGNDADDDSDDDDSNSDGGDDAGSDDSQSADDSNDDDTTGDDSDDDDSDDDAGSDDKPDDKKVTKHQFSQFDGTDGTDEQYIANLEKGYKETSQEGIRLNQELSTANGRIDAIMQAATADPELATKLNAAMNGDGTGDQKPNLADSNPFVKDLETKWAKQSEKEIEEFIEANPEVATDPKISADVKKWMGIFSNQSLKDDGTLMSGGEAMAAAYRHLGLENKLEKQNLATGAKKIAAHTRPQGSSKKAKTPKTTFSDDQIAMARKMGKDEAWLQKNAK